MPGPRSRWRRWLGIALWALAVLLLAEGAVRAVALVLRRDRPNGVVRSGAGVVYCIGDSFTFGQGVQPDEAWPRVLARSLGAGSDAGAPTVRVLAEPGRSSSVVVQLVAEVLAAGDARLVLVLTGWNANDGDFAAHRAAHHRAVPWTSVVDDWLEHARLYKVVKQALTMRGRTLQLAGVEVVPQTTAMSLYDFRAYQEIAQKNLRTIARLCRAAGVPCALLTYPHQELPPNPYTRTEYYHALFGRTRLSEEQYLVHDRRPGEIAVDAVIRTVGEAEGLPVIDLQPAFEATAPGPLFLADQHHPTAAGHALMAATVARAIAPMLRARAEPG
jgi:lysophospholipase L1-like esterase